MDIKVAILIDGSFFLKRYNFLNKEKRGFDPFDAEKTVNNLYTIALRHLDSEDSGKQYFYLYRILYYDCFPFDKKIHHPITNRVIDYSKTDVAIFRGKLIKELKKKRKVALRFGRIRDHDEWIISPYKTKDLLSKNIEISDLLENDVTRNLSQKGVDMRIGLDIAALTYKKLVNKIILIAGDSDFVPAAKVARREGIDFVLDPMWNHIDASLFEHIDGLKSTIPKPKWLYDKPTKS